MGRRASRSKLRRVRRVDGRHEDLAGGWGRDAGARSAPAIGGDKDMSRLKDKVVLVTGAAQGTGEATARLASSEGARVVVTDIQSEKAAVVAKSLGDSAIACELDVTSEESWQAAVRAATNDFGRLDGLVNNAGVLHMGAIETTPLDVITRVIAVNQIGTMLWPVLYHRYHQPISNQHYWYQSELHLDCLGYQ